jgi:actin-related protein 6
VETLIWKQCFGNIKKFEEDTSCLCLSVPPIVPDIVEQRILEVVFEDLQFDALFMPCSHSLIRESLLSQFPTEIDPVCNLVIDSGFSFTYAVPFFGGLPIKHAATRIDVGGKLLTNLMMETLSHKEINM